MKRIIHTLVAKIAAIWPGHAGVNYETTSTKNLLLLIKDAVEYDRLRIEGLKK